MAKSGLKQIALEAQVSLTLASQVLNGRDVRVSEQTKQRILDIAAKQQYVPNRLASGLKLKRTNTIAIIVPFTPIGYFSELIYHMESHAMSRGYNTLVLNTFGNCAKERKALELYKSNMIDGIIVAPLDAKEPQNHATYLKMGTEGFPFVFVDRQVHEVPADIVSSDHERIAMRLTQNLIDKGCRDILFLHKENGPISSTTILRSSGYAQAMHVAGLTQNNRGFVFEESMESNLAQVLSSIPQPDAVFLHSGYYMPHLLQCCHKAGYKAERMQFTTVDGFNLPHDFLQRRELLAQINGNCEVIIQNVKEIATIALDRLIKQIEGARNERSFQFVEVTSQLL
ncbi:MAG: hypothetical protein CVV52_16660 [Spirochaetae bacterium HGW-Spirochaetae-8]|nr:MAG: hypothetical protein CVV52_16660 [Spirochaetae bacterium HGW-Spirochaetae-8]